TTATTTTTLIGFAAEGEIDTAGLGTVLTGNENRCAKALHRAAADVEIERGCADKESRPCQRCCPSSPACCCVLHLLSLRWPSRTAAPSGTPTTRARGCLSCFPAP